MMKGLLCGACVFGKIHRTPFPISTTITKTVGKLIHTNLSGPIEEHSFGKKKYFIFKDDFSSCVLFLCNIQYYSFFLLYSFKLFLF